MRDNCLKDANKCFLGKLLIGSPQIKDIIFICDYCNDKAALNKRYWDEISIAEANLLLIAGQKFIVVKGYDGA